MKQGNILVTLVMALLAAALACYFGFHVFTTFNDPFTTTRAYEFTVNDSVEADAFLVRSETAFPAQAGIVELRRSEGERVGAGQTVALVYRDDQAMQDQTLLRRLNQQAEILQYAMDQDADAISSARLDETILRSLVTLRSSAAVGDYARLEDQVMQVKSAVLKRAYTYGADLTPEGLRLQVVDLTNQRTQLSAAAASSTTRLTAPGAGTFSSLVDGYETILTPKTMYDLSPSDLHALSKQTVSADGNAPGKLISGTHWYLVAAIPQQAADRLTPGKTISVRFSGDFDQTLSMTVRQVGQAEAGECAVILSSDRYLAQTTLLRQQTVEIVYDSADGLRVPKTALRMLESTVTDEETGQTTATRRLGLYALMAGRAEFKEVTILAEGSDFYVVHPAQEGKRALRAGDEIITRATDLYDGKLLEF